MRQIFAIIFLIYSGIEICAQDTSSQRNFDFYPAIRKWYGVKLNPASVYFGKVSLFGEYSSNNWRHNGRSRSITFGIGIPIEHEQNYIINKKDRKLRMKTFSAMIGYRVFVVNGFDFPGEISGLYFEPYLKYLSNSTSDTFNTNLATSTTTTSEVTFSSVSKYSGVGFGIQLGYQFHINQRFIVDAFLIGPEINNTNTNILLHDITSQGAWNSSQSVDAQKSINDYKKLPILGNKLNTSRDDVNRNISASYKGLLPGFRIGISIGYSFRHERRS
ncbi:MAG: hypothetical protein JWP69_1265 [Flaviaesturariibacter sp.]|nr:hypothetical protein [Flaviaesturariibacter sp.]